MATWNTRDPEVWAGSLNFPHTRPASGGHRVWQTKEDYVATTDYARVIATGWDHTEFEDLRLVHETDTKAHVAGRWLRVDTDGNPIRRNLVTYIATQIDGRWGSRLASGPANRRLMTRRSRLPTLLSRRSSRIYRRSMHGTRWRGLRR